MEANSLRHPSEIEFASLTDVGCQRERNEDSSEYWEPEGSEDVAHKGRLAVVADGMGGYEGGQEASQIAVQTIHEMFAKQAGTPQGLLVNGMKAAHERIRRSHAGAKCELRAAAGRARGVRPPLIRGVPGLGAT